MKTLIKLFAVAVITLSSNILPAQKIYPTYIGFGYNFSRTNLKGLNRFVQAYNDSPNKIGGAIIDEDMLPIKKLKGTNFILGVGIEDFIVEINWTRRYGDCVAYYEIPSYNERWIGYKTGTLGFGFFNPVVNKDYFQINTGISVDFSTVQLLTMLDSKDDGDWRNVPIKGKDKSRNFGLTPSIQIMVKPVKWLPLMIGVRPYAQWNWGRKDFSELQTEMTNTYKEDLKDLRSGGSNIGIMFQGIIDIPSLTKIKLPEKKIKPAPLPKNITISGKVLDSKTGNPVNTQITISEYSKVSAQINANSGNYESEIKNNSKYEFTLEAFGYETKTEFVELFDYTSSIYYKDFTLKKIEGQAIKLNNILFEKGSSVLMSESFSELNKLYDFLNSNKEVEIEISGHTSSEGSDSYNLKLSQDRAQSIVNYLAAKGINANRMTAKGYGETSPVATNDTEEGRILNRRVEFKVIKQ
ncbi:MAG: OmpA family protein [Saprospiraceae bacterium]|nr:OmpA family protein [Saprospiraceae bacterium]